MPSCTPPLWEHLPLSKCRCKHKTPALFLDRDGVIVEDKHYLKDPSQLTLVEGIHDLLLAAKHRSVPVVIVTNQSGVSRKYFSLDTYKLITSHLITLLGPELIHAVYSSFESTLENPYSWRKPMPTMFFAAASDWNLDLHSSLMVGDRPTDLEAAARAGIHSLYLLRNTSSLLHQPPIKDHILPFQFSVVSSLHDVVAHIPS